MTETATTGDETRVLRLAFPARPEYLVLGRLVLTGLSRARPIDEDALSDLKLALTEACSNSVRHAYGGAPGTVEVTYELTDSALNVCIEDAGPGFDAEAVSGAVDPESLNESGLGLAIIRAVADECSVRARDGGGSVLRFSKRFETA